MIKKLIPRLFIILSLHSSLFATFDFSSRDSHVAFKDSSARMRLGKVASVMGWTQESIVNAYGDNAASSWTEGYADGALIAFSGGTKPTTNLVYNNSNAINAGTGGGNTALVIQTSNALVYGLRTTSNAILALGRRITNNSNAIINLGRRITNNSNAILALGRRITNNSNAIVSLAAGGGFSNIVISTATYTFVNDVNISNDRTILVTVSSQVDGAGHSITFARNKPNVFTINPGLNVLLKNIVLKDFSDDAISLGAGSTLTFGDGVVIELAKDETLSRNWIFAGTACLNGFGNILDLGFFNIQILQPGRLIMQDLFVKKMRANNIRCVGDKGSLTIRNAELFMSSNYTLSVGGILFQQEVLVTGTNIFSYETGQTSTIDTKATLFFDTNSTFSYAPKRRINRDLIAMTDVTSRLFANGCTIKSTTTGMRLTKGTLVVDGKVTLQNSGATALSQGISFGNGTAASDLTINILGGAKLELTSGVLVYNNAS
ncbi:hypothetical protein K2W90_02815 [Candidatus Babeliales bacterium]|nr:hypothetical protein [Candidatus Babeliales bacterium]